MIVPLNSAMSRRQALALAALAALSGCGRRGPLEPPLTATATPKPASGEDDLGGPIKAPKAPPVAPPTQSLPIDKLL